MQKTIYISDNDHGLFAKAQEVLGETSTSSTIVAALKYAIEHKGKDAAAYELKDMGAVVKLYGEELALFTDENDKSKLPIFRAFKTKSGKIVISIKTEKDQKLRRYENINDFEKRGRKDLPDDREIFERIMLVLSGIPVVEVID
jgi:hypothetical protein